jgi:hypothetical protein
MNLKKFNSDYSSPMHSKNRKRIGWVMLPAGLVLACSTALYVPRESARVSKEELKEMQQGRTAYISKCGSCHSLVLPEKYNAGEWKALVKRMAPKAHLAPQEESEILKYVTKNDSSLIDAHANKVGKK